MEGPPLLEVDGVTRRFGSLVANDDVRFTVPRGGLIGLIGPNGAGKSTLFNLIAGVFAPSAGRIVFDGTDITRLPAPARCALGIARTFQVVRSFNAMTVLDNVLVGALVRDADTRAARFRAHEMLVFTGLDGRARALAGELTSPEKRRLEMARALATRPKLLLLDEVMAGLTPTEAREGIELVRRVRASGITVIMVEHVMEVVMPLVDHAIVLDLGRVIASGRPDAVVRDPRVIESYLGAGHA
ncbi:MAG: ABC transporter ATP-binding protein [Rhodobacteraceae bacterium]|nr:ABC transporter ATP-binding protein [Paracoccaceae bacterium]